MRKLGITPKQYEAPRGRGHGRATQEEDEDDQDATPPPPTPPLPPLQQQQEQQQVQQQAPQGLYSSPGERLASRQHLQRHVALAHATGGAESSAEPYGRGGSRPVSSAHVDNVVGGLAAAEAGLLGHRAAWGVAGSRGPVIPLGTGVGVAAAVAAAAARQAAHRDEVLRAAQGLRSLAHRSAVGRPSELAAGGEDAAAALRAHMAVDSAGVGLPPLHMQSSGGVRGMNSELEEEVEVDMDNGAAILSVRQRLQQQLKRLLAASGGTAQWRGVDTNEAAAGAAAPAAEALMAALAAARREAGAGSAGGALHRSTPGGQASGNARGHNAVGSGAAAVPANHGGLVLDPGALGQLHARGVLPLDVRTVAGRTDHQHLAFSVPAAAAAAAVAHDSAGLDPVLLDPAAPGQAGRQAPAARPLLHRSGPGGGGRVRVQEGEGEGEEGQWGRRSLVGRDPRAGRQLAPFQLDLSRPQVRLTAWGLEQAPAGTGEFDMGAPGIPDEPPRLQLLAKTAALLQERLGIGQDAAGIPQVGSGCEAARVAAAAPAAIAAEGGHPHGAVWERPDDRGAQPGVDEDGRQQLYYELQRRRLLQQLQQMQQLDGREHQEQQEQQQQEQLAPGAPVDSVSDGAVLVPVRGYLAAELLGQMGHKVALSGGSNQTVLLLLRTAGVQGSVGMTARTMEWKAPAAVTEAPAPPPPPPQRQQEHQDRGALQRSSELWFRTDREIGRRGLHATIMGSSPAGDDGAGVSMGGGGSMAAVVNGSFGGAMLEGARGRGQGAGTREAAAARGACGGHVDRSRAADGANGEDQVVHDAPSLAAARSRDVRSSSSVPSVRMPLLPSRSLRRAGASGGWMAPWVAPPPPSDEPPAAGRQSCHADVMDTDMAGAASAPGRQHLGQPQQEQRQTQPDQQQPMGAQLGPPPNDMHSPLAGLTPLTIPDPALSREEGVTLRGLGAGGLWMAPATEACISPVAPAAGSGGEGAQDEPSIPRQQQQQRQPLLKSVRCAEWVSW